MRSKILAATAIVLCTACLPLVRTSSPLDVQSAATAPPLVGGRAVSILLCDVFGVASGILIVKTGNGEIIYLRPRSLQCEIVKGHRMKTKLAAASEVATCRS